MYSLYVHIPFCGHRCAYCDFNTYDGQEDFMPAYVEALCREIDFTGNNAPEHLTLHSVFFGGGTPSLLTSHQFEAILNSISRNFKLGNPEITIEANPGTVMKAGLGDLRTLGINRISFGAQSANQVELRMLERSHTFFDVINAVTWSRQTGFNNLNLDLIYGLPHQSLDDWSASVKRVLELGPEHLSLYALTIEPGTPFGKWASRGLIPLPDPDLAADMYEWAGDVLEGAGYLQYEISNWARDNYGSQTVGNLFRPPSRACQHNLQYWRGLPYLAVGAGAHGYAAGYRYSNSLRIQSYIERMSRVPAQDLPFPRTPAAVDHHRQSEADDMGEFMMTGLRLTREGVSAKTFHKRFGDSLENVFGGEIEELLNSGLVAWQAERLLLTRRGRLLGNRVFARFLSL